MLKRLKQAWKQDRLGVLAVSAACFGFILWALPVVYVACEQSTRIGDGTLTFVIGCLNAQFFNSWNFPSLWVGLGVGGFLLLLRRR